MNIMESKFIIFLNHKVENNIPDPGRFKNPNKIKELIKEKIMGPDSETSKII